MTDTANELRLQITGMDCAACARTIESGVAKLKDVDSAALNFTTGTLRVCGPVAPERVVARVRELGYDVGTTNDERRTTSDERRPPAEASPLAQASPLARRRTTDDGRQSAEHSGHDHHNHEDGHDHAGHDHDHAGDRSSSFVVRSSPSVLGYFWSRGETRAALIAALLVVPGLLFDELLPGLGIHSPVFAALSVLAMVIAGWPVARSAVRALRVNHEVTINLLMTIAAIGAVVIGAYTEAGLVMVLFALGEALEGYTAGRARDTIRGLSALAPAEATVLGDGGETRRPVADLRAGDRIVVRPGERLPMDGRVLAGASAVDQAPITGESRPVDKAPGDEVFAGSINGPGALEVEVTHLAEDTTISRMIRLVAEAQESRAPAQRFVDRFARVYTPAVIVIALLVAAVPPLLFGAPFWNPAPDVHGWLYRALALLVVACPCALVISTPVTIVSAISNAARHGILFKGGTTLEELSRVRAMAFDKTGTITRGEPAVLAVVAAEDGRRSADDLLALAAAVERRSEHPLARAVVAAAEARGVATRYPAAQDVMANSGRGVSGQVDGQRIELGSHAWFDEAIDHLPHCDAIRAADARGHTTMLVSSDGDYRGYIALADATRPDSAAALAELRQLGLGPLVMLTGDHAATAERIAAEVGLSDVRAGLLPQDKVAAVEALRAEHGAVAMVGDGINDTPALAAASVGVAMGRAPQALETADVALLGDDFRQLPFAVRLARAAMGTVRVNVALSIAVKLVFFVLVLLGSGSMWLAVLADVGTSLLVTANGMRLLRWPRRTTNDERRTTNDERR